jgi:hypothetical protein
MMNDSTRTAAADTEPGKPQATTGDPRVDEALASLSGLAGLPDSGHVEAYEHVYQRLHGLLDDAHPVSGDHPDGQAEPA